MTIILANWTQTDVTLIVNGCSVRELVSREGDRGFCSVAVVREWAENLLIQRASVAVNQPLLAPSNTISHEAVGDVKAVGILLVDVNHQLEWIADLDVFRKFIVWKYFHMARGHWNFICWVTETNWEGKKTMNCFLPGNLSSQWSHTNPLLSDLPWSRRSLPSALVNAWGFWSSPDDVLNVVDLMAASRFL